MATTSISALRLATSVLLPRQTLTRTLRLDIKRSLYLSSAFHGKKKRAKSGDPPGANDNSHNLKRTSQQQQQQQRRAGFDIDGEDYDLGMPVRNQVSSRENSPRPAVVKMESLMDFIRVRRQQAARTLLFAPDLQFAADPCPRYMRHKIESLVGRVRHVTLTSVVTSSKTDLQALPTLSNHSEKFIRKTLLVEFQDQEQMNCLITNHTGAFPKSCYVTHCNRLLYCHGRWSQSSSSESPVDLNDALNACASVSEQIESLVERTELDDAGIRARFLLCDIIESLVKAIFPGCHVLPFGSTLSGLARADSDVDLVLRLASNDTNYNLERPFSAYSVRTADMVDSKAVVVKQLMLVHEIMRAALPGYGDFTRIFRANVPIVTFRHSYTNLCCDLSVQSTDSILAAQLLNSYMQLDPRIKPLLFTIRRWSIAQKLSSFLTNFPLCCLALFYLMEEKVVPPMNVALEADTDHVASIPTSIRWKSPNTSSTLEDLLHGFFQFYSKFDFERDAVSVFYGKIKEKVTTDKVEIENPLDREVNCARLIEHWNQFPVLQNAIQNSATALAEKRKPIPLERGGNPEDYGTQNWGVTCIIDDSIKSNVEVMMEGDVPEVTMSDEMAISLEEGNVTGGLFNTQVLDRPPRPNPPTATRTATAATTATTATATTRSKDIQVMSILNEIFESEKGQENGGSKSVEQEEPKFSMTSINFVEDEIDREKHELEQLDSIEVLGTNSHN